MKVALIFAAFTAVVHAGVVVPAGPAALIESGSSRVARTEDNLGNYAFGYDEVHTTGGSFRREQASPNGGVTGSYGLRDADGRLRTVNYIADAAGFRAAISTNEPGTESKNTAGALYNQGEVPPGPVIDETVLLQAPVAPGRLLAAPSQLAYGPGPAQLLAAPAPVAAVAQAPLFAPAPVAAPVAVAAPAPLHLQQQQFFAPGPVAAPLLAPAPVASQAVNAFNHGPFLGAPGISAPVLNAPGVNVFGQLTNAAVPTVNANPLTDGPFARFSRPALSTPAALATGPLAAPLSPFQPTPLASPNVAASGQLLSAPVAPGPLAPGLAVSNGFLAAHGAPLTQSFSQFFAPQAVAAAPLAAPVAAHAPLAHAHAGLIAQQRLVHQQVGVAPAAIAGVAYQTTINHQLAPVGLAAPAPIVQAPIQQFRQF